MVTQPSMTNRMIPPGIAADVAAERNYRSIQSERQLAAYDHQLTTRQQQIPGMLFPVYRLGEPEPYTYVLRPERPRLGYDGKTIKYEWPERVPLCLDILPRYRAALADVTIPIWITEGAKKADALASAFGASIVPINLNGVWGWKQRGHDGASHPLEDLDHIAWAGRQVVLAFDNDVTRKAEVQDALKALRRHLSSRGAVVDVLYLPDTGEKLGVDDALAGGMSPEQLHAYISTSPDQAPPESSVGEIAELDTLTPEEWKRRYLALLAERDQWKQRAEAAETALEQTKERNRFVTQATGANIAAAGKRDTLIELKKELDTATGEGRQDGEWTRIRPKYMGKCTNQNESTISRHLAEFEHEGWIERACKRTKDPETGEWTSASYVRPLIDLGDPSQVSLPAKPRGLSACEKCGSVKLKRRSVLRCTCCGHEQSTPEEWANPKEVRALEDEILANAGADPELQIAIQEDAPAGDVAAFFDQLPEPAAEALNCSLQDTEKGTEIVLSSELQFAIQKTIPTAHDTGSNGSSPAAAARSQTIVRPDLYARYAAQAAPE